MNNIIVIPVFIPFYGCPNKCFFCNQNLVTGKSSPALPEKDELLSYFNNFLSYSKNKKRPVEIAFFGGNFLGMENDIILKYLEIAEIFCQQGENRGIRFSTRPDTICMEKIALLSGFSVKTIELGIQSMDNRVLRKSGRGHTAEDSLKAVELIKNNLKNISLGLQIMPGLPGETRQSIFKTLKFLKYSKPDYLRIYPLVILKNTHLEKLYNKGLFKPLSLDKAVEVSSLIRDFSKKNNITIIRTGLPGEAAQDDNIVSGPWHPCFGELVISKSFYKKAIIKIIVSGKETKEKNLILRLNPVFESAARGFKNNNFLNLKKRFEFKSIIVKKDSSIKPELFFIEIKE
ncbi:MAG: radical SAM protein [Desulforegulaceae bacterium]|nr:radical SAM protein [Desulforegulaceae bacterium]